jgi:FMNH2-dependent dimethyl sulfone monooxygenase
LIAELNLNDIKGEQAPSLDAWSTAAALAAVTQKQELMVAVRPTFHNPALLAKQAANIDHISGGRLTLNVVSSWWRDEATKYGVGFEQHDDRYARTAEWLTVLDGVWQQDGFSFDGKYYHVTNNTLQPKPVSRPRPALYAGGESETAKDLISSTCDGYVMHGDEPATIGKRIRDMKERREKKGLPPMRYGVAAYSVIRNDEAGVKKELARITDVRPGSAGYNNYQQWLAGTQLEQKVSLEDYSVSNRGFAFGTGGDAGAGGGQDRRLRTRRCRLLPAPMQPPIGRNGTVCRRDHSQGKGVNGNPQNAQVQQDARIPHIVGIATITL